MHFDPQSRTLVGEQGSLALAENDEVALKLAMLIEGECEGRVPRALRVGIYCKQRYLQLRAEKRRILMKKEDCFTLP